MSESPRGVAVVGLGVGLAHLLGYVSGEDRYRVVALCDADADRAERTAGGLPGVEVDSFDGIVARDDIEMVSVCTPPHLHVEQSLALLRAGKHVVCEKPLAASLAEVDLLAATESETGRWLVPVYQCRFNQGVRQLQRLTDAGLAGQPYTGTAEIGWRRRAEYYSVPWRGQWATELGGTVVSHALHALDLTTHVLGPATRVFARLDTRVNEIETEDTGVIALEHENGALSTVTVTTGSTPQVSRLRFSFEHLTAMSDHEGDETGADPWVLTGDTDDDQAAIDAELAGFTPGPPHWIGLLADLADALDAGVPPPVTLADARAGLEVATACYRSARTGTDVELPLSPDDPDHGGWWL